ncbi:uncharacterized protein [Leptinotarsa decemlineata]|uniref:uncharacterized protein n=1 Tax=Leptinotarsa decemlineata TaxID=7539 RepID=UPI003D304CE7
MVWSSVHVSTLIEEYQKYPCLYAIKHPLYQKRKMEKAIKSGAGVDCVYVPSLWYFEKNSYLTEHVTPRPSKSNLDACEEQESHNVLSPIIRERKNKNTIHIVEDVQEYEDQNNLSQISCDDETKDSENEQYEEIIIETTMDEVHGFQQEDNNFQNQSTPQNKKQKMNKKPSESAEQNVMKDASKAHNDITNAIKSASQETNSAEDMYGKLVAERLKSITDRRKRVRAQQDIDAILYQYLIDD